MATGETWGGWCDSTSNSITISSVSNVWLTWAGETTTGTSGAVTTDATWVYWTNSTATCGSTISIGEYVDSRTPEQIAAQEAEWAAQQVETQRRADIAAAERKLATEKARRLLLSMLDEQQRAQLERSQFFDVIAKGSRRRYRIHQGSHGNVRLLNEQGHEVTRYCGQPNGVPTEDSMLAQKLQIEHDEAEFVKRANATRLIA